MRYDLSNLNHRTLLLCHAEFEGDACPVDDICDSVPQIINYIKSLDDKIRNQKNEIQRLQADLKDAERKINNLKSQKFRICKKKGKTLHQ